MEEVSLVLCSIVGYILLLLATSHEMLRFLTRTKYFSWFLQAVSIFEKNLKYDGTHFVTLMKPPRQALTVEVLFVDMYVS